VGYTAETWLQLVALTVGAQLLGHSLFNKVLRTTSPTVVSLALLFEVPGAAVIAAIALGQTPPLAALPAAILLLVGIGLVISSRPRDVEAAVPVE
jgi:drug/metabolite transporter (DMT)-like permease